MANAAALLTWARNELGTVEKPPGSNRVPYWDQIGMSHLQGQPWCAAFCLAGLERIGVGPVSRSVYVPQIRNDYRRAGRLKAIEDALPGDQVFFSFGNYSDRTHTGIVESVDLRARTVTSVDGNTTSALGSRPEWNGGGVFRRTRLWVDTWGVGRPQFDPVPPVVVTPFPEDRMRRLDMTAPGLDPDGNGYTDLFEVAPFRVVSVEVNTAGYKPAPRHKGGEDHGGHHRLLWEGPKNAGAFAFRVWVAD